MLGWFFKTRGKLSDHSDPPIPIGRYTSKFPCLKNFISSTWWFALFCCLIIMYYTVLQTFPQLWYFGPVIVYGCIIFLCAVTDILSNALQDDLCSQSVKPSLPKVTMDTHSAGGALCYCRECECIRSALAGNAHCESGSRAVDLRESAAQCHSWLLGRRRHRLFY